MEVVASGSTRVTVVGLYDDVGVTLKSQGHGNAGLFFLAEAAHAPFRVDLTPDDAQACNNVT
jgi:hypothetical protein